MHVPHALTVSQSTDTPTHSLTHSLTAVPTFTPEMFVLSTTLTY